MKGENTIVRLCGHANNEEVLREIDNMQSRSYNQEILGIAGMYKEERSYGEFNTYKIYKDEE